VQPNPGWRNAMLPARDGNGTRVTNQPLALDLYYLLTAWGTADFEAEILLGYAMQLFHEMPVLSRDVIRKTFESDPVVKGTILPDKFQNLAAAALADQFELLKITPHIMAAEESSKLWSAIQVNYRPSVAYQVSVVLIESEARTRAALPVLTRAIGAQADTLPPVPTLFSVTPPNSQPAVRLGESLTLTGAHLDGASVKAVLRHPHATVPAIGPLAAVTATQATVPIPNAPAVWPAGNYTIALVVTGTIDRVSNSLPLAVAPVIDIGGSSAARDLAQNLTVTLKCTPTVLPKQTALLILGEMSAVSEAHDTPTQTLTFKFPKAEAPPAGTWPVRLRIDGVESIFIDRTKTPPVFDATQQLTIP